jgi:hypothetical protein
MLLPAWPAKVEYDIGAIVAPLHDHITGPEEILRQAEA